MRRLKNTGKLLAVLLAVTMTGLQAWAAGPGETGPSFAGGQTAAGSTDEAAFVELPFPVLLAGGDGWGGNAAIYDGPDFSANAVNALWPGEAARLLEYSGGDWAKILYSGRECYVYTGNGDLKEIDRWPIPKSDENRGPFLACAVQYLGGPYRFGGTDPATGADCSGFIRAVMAQGAGIDMPRTSWEQAGVGAAVDYSQVRCGDLLFFGGGGSVNHVAIYMGNGTMLQSENTENGVTITKVEGGSQLIGVRRVLPD